MDDRQKAHVETTARRQKQRSPATGLSSRSLPPGTNPSSGRPATRDGDPLLLLIGGRLHWPRAHARSGRPTSTLPGGSRTTAIVGGSRRESAPALTTECRQLRARA